MTKQELSDYWVGGTVEHLYCKTKGEVKAINASTISVLFDGDNATEDCKVRSLLTILPDRPKFKVGDQVEIVDCPARTAKQDPVGSNGAIGRERKFGGHKEYKVDHWWYIAASLRLITEDKPEEQWVLQRNILTKQPIKENSTMPKFTKFQKSIDMQNADEVAVAETFFHNDGTVNTCSPLFGQWLFNKFKADPELVKLAVEAVAERDKEDE